MRYLFCLSIVLNSCVSDETDTTRVLDRDAYELRLTIARDLKTVELGRTIEGVPKKYRLQLHAFINHARPLGKDAAGNFLPLVFAYVVFSYWEEEPTAVHTCVLKDVVIGMPHALQAKHCTSGDAVLQKVRACVSDASKNFKIAESAPHNLSCVKANPVEAN